MNQTHLESDTRNVTNSVARSTKTSDQDFVVLVDVVEATVVGNEGGDLLAVLDKLNSHTLSDGRVGLLGLNTKLLNNNSLCVRSTPCISNTLVSPSQMAKNTIVCEVGLDNKMKMHTTNTTAN